MNVRAVGKEDTSVWLHMRNALWPDSKEEHLTEINAYFEQNSIGIVHAAVVEHKAKVVGFIELNIRNFAEGSRNAKVPYVEAWYIKPEVQGMGYGTKLMAYAEQWAKLLGYTELASDTELENQRSIAMHKYLGFKETERVVCFLKEL